MGVKAWGRIDVRPSEQPLPNFARLRTVRVLGRKEEQLRVSRLGLPLCIAFFAFNVSADEQQKAIAMINLQCTPDRCENWHFDSGTKISMTTDCISHAASTELSFPSRNGTHITEKKEMKARQVIDVTDTAVKRTFTWEMGGIKTIQTILVSRIDGRFNETKESYSQWGTDRSKLSGMCLAASELTKRKF